jgi:thiol-disulfide isomerase/thioredoxin
MAVGVVAALALAVGLFLKPSSSPAVASFSLPRLGGGPAVVYPPASSTGGGAAAGTVITFFASWCTPCHKDVPVIATFANGRSGSLHGVRFVGVDGDDAPTSGLAFARTSGVHFPVGSDQNERVANALGLTGLPDTVFVNGSGHVVHIVRGPVTAGELREWTGRISST